MICLFYASRVEAFCGCLFSKIEAFEYVGCLLYVSTGRSLVDKLFALLMCQRDKALLIMLFLPYVLKKVRGK